MHADFAHHFLYTVVVAVLYEWKDGIWLGSMVSIFDDTLYDFSSLTTFFVQTIDGRTALWVRDG